MPEQINSHLQDSLLRLAITNDEFLSLISGQVEPKIFPSRMSETIIRICLDYFLLYKKAPKDHFHDEMVRVLEAYPEDAKQQFIAYVTRLKDMKEPNAPYVLRRLNGFIKYRSREEAAIQFADLIYEGKIPEADAMMYRVLKTGIEKEEIGHDYFHDFSDLINRGEKESYLMSTGIKALDKLVGGYQRSQLLVTLGGYKAGKTWSLMHIARTALLQGLNVLHLSHEVSKEEMGVRYDMMFSARGSRNIGQTVEYLLNQNGELKKHQEKIRSVYNDKAVILARQNIRRFGGRLIIKKYPQTHCSFMETERLLNYLETYEDFVPDVVIQDYFDIMKLGAGNEHRHKLNEIYMQHKGLADERNILVATVSQVTTEALKKRIITQKDVAEDKRKVGNCDLMLAICRTPQDEQVNTGRIYVVASRSGRQNCECHFSGCLDIGQFCISSWLARDFHKSNKDLDKDVYAMFGEEADEL